MSHFFLLNNAIELGNYPISKNGMLKLAEIIREEGDSFLKHSSIYNTNLYTELCNNYGSDEQSILVFIEQLVSAQNNITDESESKKHYADELFAFLGVDFSKTAISRPNQIRNEDEYKTFCTNNLWTFTFRTMWGKREKLFPNLILCGEVKNQLQMIGGSSHFNQIIDRLREFNDAVAEWKTGDFSYKQINQNYSLRISPETSQTMDKYGNERIFSLPKGGTQTFELHIKTGDLRFHFYPENNTKKIYVGYIGPHLSTVSN